jgi:hypothetical protein
MSNENKVETNKEAKKKFEINVTEHVPFNGIVEEKFIRSTDFCKLVSDLFRSVFIDFEGCIYEVNQQGVGSISLFFNHAEAEPTDDGRVAAVTRVIPDKNGDLKNETVRRIRLNDSRNRQGDRFYLTEAAASALVKFVSPNMIKKDGTLHCDKVMSDVVYRQAFYGQPAINYSKVSFIDPNALATEIYGATNEDGSAKVYGVYPKNTVPQQYTGNFMGNGVVTDYFLSIKRVDEHEVNSMCNTLGVSPNQGMNIIR